MEISKLSKLSISLLKLEDADRTNMSDDPARLMMEMTRKARISINIKETAIAGKMDDDDLKFLTDDMYGALYERILDKDSINYVQVEAVYDGEKYETALPISSLSLIEEYSAEKTSGVYELLLMAIPD